MKKSPRNVQYLWKCFLDFAVLMTRVNFLLLIGRLCNLIPNMEVCVLNESSRILGEKKLTHFTPEKIQCKYLHTIFFLLLCLYTYFIFKNNNCVSTQHTCHNMKA